MVNTKKEKIGRNDPCICGSGKKYKNCCLNRKKFLSFVEVTGEEKERVLKIYEKKKPIEPNLSLVRSIEHKGNKIRCIWNTLFFCNPVETFHEFIINFLINTLGEAWFNKEKGKALKDRHIIMQWYKTFFDWKKSEGYDKKEISEGVYTKIPSGEVRALVSLAYDNYCLQTQNKLPEFLIHRLRIPKEFQGVRYEIAVAALLERAGFDVEFLDQEKKNEKHCDFLITHKKTKLVISVESKSRRRKGVLHETGQRVSKITQNDLNELIKRAKKQKMENTPFFVFIDANMEPSPGVQLQQKEWFKNIFDTFDYKKPPAPEHPDKFNLLCVTNFSDYYFGKQEVEVVGEHLIIVTSYPEVKIQDEYLQQMMYDDILDGLKNYSKIPIEV